MKPFRLPILLMLAAMLAACSILPETTPVQILDPRPEPGSATLQPVDWSLDIALPSADPQRDSNRVLVRTADGRLQVHGQARWAAAAPELLRLQLVRSLRDRELFADIGAGSSGGDRLLTIDLRRFELDAGSALEAVIELEARLLDAPGYRLAASRLVEVRASLASADSSEINAAFSALLTELVDELAAWMLSLPGPQSDPTGQVVPVDAIMLD